MANYHSAKASDSGLPSIVGVSLFVCFLIVSVFCVASCSNPETAKNANAAPKEPVSNSVAANEAATSEVNSEAEYLGPSGGKNQAKKNGWFVPTRDKRVLVRKEVNLWPTEKGKEVEVIRSDYSYDPPWPYSEDFRDIHGPLKIETHFLMEHSVKGKVFMYSIFAKRTRITPPSNSEPHEDTFVYLIADRDGDGIFETLIGDEKMTVPKWVLK